MGSPKTAIICQLLGRVKKLGLSTKDLIPVALKMDAADNHDIRILGATILRLPPYSDYQGGTNNQGTNNQGEKTSTRHVTSNTDKLFLSSCTDLGATITPQPQGPKRTPIPTALPNPATATNRDKLEQYPLQVQHQTLPLMEGPPMRQTHMPLQLPTIHQYRRMKCLDRDVRLGVRTNWRPGHMVPSYRHLCQENWKTSKDHRLPSPRHQGNTPYPIAFPSSTVGSPREEFDAWNGYHGYHSVITYCTVLRPVCLSALHAAIRP